MSDIAIAWKKINRGLPKIRRFADDRAPTIEEIQNICDYPDRRIKGIVSTMASSGIRLGAWAYLRWGHIKPVDKEGKILAAKIVVYHGDEEEYFSFMTAEAYHHLEEWIEYRRECGEKITNDTWVMRQLWNTKLGHYHHGTIKAPEKLKSSGVKKLIEDALSMMTMFRYLTPENIFQSDLTCQYCRRVSFPYYLRSFLKTILYRALPDSRRAIASLTRENGTSSMTGSTA